MFKYLESRNYEYFNQHVLSHLTKGNEVFLQRMSILKTLDIHRGCVNSVVWDDAGEYLLSGSDDQQLIISAPWNGKAVRKLRTSHRANIFSAKFIPYSSNNQIISCSGDGILIYTDLNQYDETYDCRYTCHVGTCYDVITVPSDPYSFLSCGEDGTVRWFDLRIKTSCLSHECKEDILLNMGRAVTAIAVNPLAHYQLAVATQDSTIHVYDRRMLGTKAHDSYLCESNKAILMRLKPQNLEGKKHRVTSLRYSSRGDQVLASYSSDYLYLFDTQDFKEIPLDGASSQDSYPENDSEPTLKRLRLRGDWSDTGPQAVPQGEMANQAEDVGQARPTLQSTLMQRMTDILSRMLHAPSQRGGNRRPGNSDGDGNAGGDQREEGDEGEHVESVGEIVSVPEGSEEGTVGRETSSAPPSIASPADISFIQPRLSDPSVLQPFETTSQNLEPMSLSGSPDEDRMSEEEFQSPSNDENLTESFHRDEIVPSCIEQQQQQQQPEEFPNVSEIDLPTSENPCEVTEEENLSFVNLTSDPIVAESLPSTSGTQSTSNKEEGAIYASSADNCEQAHEDDIETNEDSTQSSSSLKEVPRESTATRSSQETSPDRCSLNRNCRMAKLVDKVIQRKRAENASKNVNEAERWVPYGKELQQYRGHRNARTMIKEACFWGESHVMSGSDCGRVFVWEKKSGRLVMLWEADRHVVNCLQPHPTLPILATSGIDYDVKLWAPIRAEAVFDEEKATEIAKRNEMLLAETRDTVTVPATFMIRMLATLNQLRHDRMRIRNQNPEDDDDDD